MLAPADPRRACKLSLFLFSCEFRSLVQGEQQLTNEVELVVNTLLEAAKPCPHHQPTQQRSKIFTRSRLTIGRIQDFRDRQIQPLELGDILFVEARDYHMVRRESWRKPRAPSLCRSRADSPHP